MNYLKSACIVLLFCTPSLLWAQSNQEVIKDIQKFLLEHYIFLDKAKETNLHLDDLMATNYFESYTDPKEFAKALSVELQKITKDKHLNVIPPRAPRPASSPSNFTPRHLTNLVRFRSRGFGTLDLLEGNVGYVELKGFRKEDLSKVDAVMDYLSTSDAIIVDLRENGGGGGLGLYWSSYFLEEGTPLTGTYERRTNSTVVSKTGPVQGHQRLEVPLFILTSSTTFSAAEAFAYNLQSRGRATIIGETTGGGAHPVKPMWLPNGYRLIVPYAASINPVTQSNWEGVGVTPDVLTTKENTLAKAKELAVLAAQQYREQTFEQLNTILAQQEITKEEEEKACTLFRLLLQRGHLEDHMINYLGYTYLEHKQLHAAYVILKSNVTIFPANPNAHDSYAEILALKGNKKEALKEYQQAVLLAKERKDPQLNAYQKNLSDFEAK